jgi:hypothetical protein
MKDVRHVHAESIVGMTVLLVQRPGDLLMHLDQRTVDCIYAT